MNQGSGEWWLYGKDSTFFYTTLPSGIRSIKRSEADIHYDFDPLDYTTWPTP
ncbi:hypothetical protein OAB00_01685 [Akkermansiaceae bacterium]|nr:hypothetical protein [Akkermansiaceae bacterium]